jgi:hypothetical protein
MGRVFSKIVQSESLTTIPGTLLVAFGVNILTGVHLLSGAPWDPSDSLRLAVSFPAIYAGAILLRCSESGRRWAVRYGRLVEQGATVSAVKSELDSFLKGAGVSPEWVAARRHLRWLMLSGIVAGVAIWLAC